MALQGVSPAGIPKAFFIIRQWVLVSSQEERRSKDGHWTLHGDDILVLFKKSCTLGLHQIFSICTAAHMNAPRELPERFGTHSGRQSARTRHEDPPKPPWRRLQLLGCVPVIHG